MADFDDCKFNVNVPHQIFVYNYYDYYDENLLRAQCH